MSLNWGIAGCGLISFDFAQSLKKCVHPNKLVAVASTDKERALQFAQKVRKWHENPMVYGSYDELFSDSNVDIVYVGVVNHKHKEVAIRALECGKHVLCEKPLGVNLQEAMEMFRAANANGRFLMEATWSRFFPAYKKLRQIIERKELGEVVGCGANFTTKALPKNRYWPAGGASPLNDIGSYCVQFAHWAMREFGKPVKITADCGKNEEGCDLWDAIILQYPEGRKATLFLSSEDCAPNCGYVSFERGYVAVGPNFWCPEKLTLKREGDEQPEEIEYPLEDDGAYNFANSSGLRYEADHCFECIHEGELESCVHGREESFKTIEVLDKIRAQLGITYLEGKDEC